MNEFTQCLVGFVLFLYKFSVLCFLFQLSSFSVLSPMLPVSVDSLLLIILSDLFNIYLYKIYFCVKMLKEAKKQCTTTTNKYMTISKQKVRCSNNVLANDEAYSICNRVCQWLTAGWWFSLGTLVSSTNKNGPPRYSWNIVESGITRYNRNLYP